MQIAQNQPKSFENMANLCYICVTGGKNMEKTQNLENVKTIKEKKSAQEKKQEFFRFVKFLLFSISAGVIQFGSFALMTEAFGWDNFWGPHIISVVLSVIWNFTFNRKFTFKSANNVPFAMMLVLAYYVVFTPASAFGGQALENAGWNGLLVEALMMIINFVTEFLYQRYVVFKNSLNTNSLAKRKIKEAILQMEQSKFAKTSVSDLKKAANVSIEKSYKKEI